MADDASADSDQQPPPSSPPPSPPTNSSSDSNSTSSSSPPPSPPDNSQSPPSSPPPSQSPPSPPPPQQEAPAEEQSVPSPPPPPTANQQPPPQNQSPPTASNNQTSSTPRPPTDTSSSSTSTSGGTQSVVPVPPGAPKHVNPTRSSPKQLANDTTSSSSSSSSSSDGSSSSSGNKIVIVGLVAGSFVLLLLVLICVLCLRRKRRRDKGGDMPPYGWEHGPSPQGNQYWKASPQNHGLKISPTPPVGFGHPVGRPMGSPLRAGSNHYNDNAPSSDPRLSSSMTPPRSLTLGFNKSTFTYDELSAATNGFSAANMLGQGGFGYVHKGVLPNGKEIAVKCLKSGSGQGEREFQAEVDIISRVHHRHLVSLVGYCIAGDQRMLVYEFVSNNNLEYHLHVKGHPPLEFSTRLRIALGSAKGLSYLHEDCHPRIIHRDIKASNILLDNNFEAMVADFGLAKLTSDTNTHVSTRVMGTFGYLAPEYASSGKLTEKSDVFSFGVMLLELITGRRPVDPDMKYMEDSLVDWARPLLTKTLDTGNYDELVDPRLERNYNRHEMQRMAACAAASIRHSAKRRPKMSQIVRVLEGDVSLDDLNVGVKPGHNSVYGSSDGSEYDTRQYSADLKKFRLMAFSTQNLASSEYGGTTSEYGLNPSSSSSDNSREMK